MSMSCYTYTEQTLWTRPTPGYDLSVEAGRIEEANAAYSLVETVEIASSFDDLYTANSVEIGRISNISLKTNTAITLHYVADLFELVSDLSDGFTIYYRNCRWFARSLFVNVTVRFDTLYRHFPEDPVCSALAQNNKGRKKSLRETTLLDLGRRVKMDSFNGKHFKTFDDDLSQAVHFIHRRALENTTVTKQGGGYPSSHKYPVGR
jgi:hypothetical protein